MTDPIRRSLLWSPCFSPLQVETWNFFLCILYLSHAIRVGASLASQSPSMQEHVAALWGFCFGHTYLKFSHVLSIILGLNIYFIPTSSSHHGHYTERWRRGGHTVPAPFKLPCARPVLTPQGTLNLALPQLSSDSQLSLLSFPFLSLVPMVPHGSGARLCLHSLLFWGSWKLINLLSFCCPKVWGSKFCLYVRI